MMRKIFFNSLLFLTLPIMVQAQETEDEKATRQSFRLLTVNDMMKPLKPQFLQNYIHTGNLRENWFFGLTGGINALSGSPLGCGDLFDRSYYCFHAHAGKWINPNVGVRLAFQGFKFKDMNMEPKSFQAYHTDFMYNIAPLFRKPTENLSRWDLALYMGLGFAHGRDISYTENGNLATASNYPFILAYGMNVKYRISKSLHLTGELGAFTTFANFDGYGKSSHFKDNLLSTSIGIAFTFAPGWKHAIDANNYIAQNNYLVNYCNELIDKNKQLLKDFNVNENIIKQLRKILEMEGLLDKYNYIFKDKGASNKNNYKGLLSLRARIREMLDNDNFHTGKNEIIKLEEDDVNNGMSVPIYFFFKLGTSTLTDNSPLVNLRELAKVLNKHGLHVKIDGAADSETGTVSINNNLSFERSSFIANELMKLGVGNSFISFTGRGGIREFEKPEQNRYARVAIILDLNT